MYRWEVLQNEVQDIDFAEFLIPDTGYLEKDVCQSG
jgi:hypothetical protein